MISIIIRTKNEERWIGKCLDAIKSQSYTDWEIVLVDNQSTDKTVEKAFSKCPKMKLVEIEEFIPGKAINDGIRASSGEYIVCLSAHCIPVHNDWLKNLVENLSDENIAGVYGRQVPTSFSSPSDTRDLLITFGLDKRIQIKDTFFHNANSIIPRRIWDKFPFDESVTNIEDRVWGQRVIEAGYRIIYEPEAEVYHHHGIHQNNRPDRVRNVVKIMEGLGLSNSNEFEKPFDPALQEVVVFIPVSDDIEDIELKKNLLKRTIMSAKESSYVKKVFVLTDDEKIISYVQDFDVETPFLRPTSLSSGKARVNDVLKFFLEKLEGSNYHPDIVVTLEVTHPFRPKELIDQSVGKLILEGLDSVIAGKSEYRPCWVKEEAGMVQLTEYTKHKQEREPIHIGLIGLISVTYSEVIRSGKRLGSKIGIIEIDDSLSSIEVRTRKALEQLEK